MAPIWTVIYIAPTRTAAEMLKGLLTKEGFLVQLRAGSGTQQGEPGGPVEVLVPASEVEEAHEILTGALGR